ncbi:hypothetical protein B0H13DRAFT_1879260 [Mycena leptocephala]|nr:hypothetical protein B0H13DRAFT_1879260 [Mycena leptocephala]
MPKPQLPSLLDKEQDTIASLCQDTLFAAWNEDSAVEDINYKLHQLWETTLCIGLAHGQEEVKAVCRKEDHLARATLVKKMEQERVWGYDVVEALFGGVAGSCAEVCSIAVTVHPMYLRLGPSCVRPEEPTNSLCKGPVSNLPKRVAEAEVSASISQAEPYSNWVAGTRLLPLYSSSWCAYRLQGSKWSTEPSGKVVRGKMPRCGHELYRRVRCTSTTSSPTSSKTAWVELVCRRMANGLYGWGYPTLFPLRIFVILLNVKLSLENKLLAITLIYDSENP